ncbi:MAG: GNAT family N-acetyltransferase [Candidatus Thorarchaeota archaeon]
MTIKQLDWLNVPDGFEFGVVETDEELEELIKFNATIHEPTDGEFLKRLIENLPRFGREMNFYIRDSEKGYIVSSINAIPSIWEYDGIALNNLELGFVGTLKEYRNKGLLRILYSYFEKLLKDYDISTIQGIPYLYRTFGYDFIIPLGRKFFLAVDHIPSFNKESPPDFMNIVIRPATKSDRADIVKLYDELKSRLLVSVRRDEELWNVQERLKVGDDDTFETMVIERENTIDGYFRVLVRGKTSTAPYEVYLDVIESSIRSFDSVMRTLHFLKEEAIKKSLYLITVPGTTKSNLSRIALDFGSAIGSEWKHQIRVPNVVKFLNTIRPVLERRLQGTIFKDLSQVIFINTYRHCYVLNFNKGSLKPIDDIGVQEIGTKREIRMPPPDFVRLILGEYSIDELRRINMDFVVTGSHKALLETLFPKRESYIFLYQC